MWLPAECIPALSMLSIHSPDYVFTVLVSIFMKTHNHFLSAMQCYKYVYTAIYSKSDGVLHFHYSHMHVRTPPALCLGTECWTRPKNPQNSRGFIGEVQQCESIWHRYAPEDRNVHNECKPGPEILKIKRDVIGEIQQYEWPKNPQNSKEFYRWCAACNVRSESSTDMLWSTIGALSLHQKSPSPCTNGFIGILGNVRVWPRNPQEVKFGNMILVLKS